MDAHARRFRERSADRLHKIALLLEQWLDDWQEGEFPGDTLSPPEYPFTRSLEDLVSEVYRAVDLLSREVCECGGYEDEHAYDCAQYEPKHRANEPMVMIPQREHTDALAARATWTDLYGSAPNFDGGARFTWWGWTEEADLDNDDDRKDVWYLTIVDGGEELATIVHRTCPDENGIPKYPIDGEVARRKELAAQMIVHALRAAQDSRTAR